MPFLTKFRRKPGWKTSGPSPAMRDFARDWVATMTALRPVVDENSGLIPADALHDLSNVLRETLTHAVGRGAKQGQKDVRGAYSVRKDDSPRAVVSSVAENFSFDLTNPAVQTYIEQHTGELITAISQSQREAVQAIVTNAYAQGLSPYDTGKLLQSSVGLSGRWAQALSTYRAGLAESGTEPALLDRLVSRYGDTLLKARGELIARTEILSAENEGRVASWMQAQAQGLISADTHEKSWLATEDERECPQCEDLDGTTVGLNEDFDDGDPPVHPDCRCTVVLEETGNDPTQQMADYASVDVA